ncbi:3-hydroxyacyl-CoA dehydrogenase family protein [Leucobacter sp. UT-8R-CII-1-4]|uniref:3-hydroxyacyl-CoA dehydrogenase family protein n=1 Tax=Leucobacter sp. UT-8R-CII-1-4 TaxID=3040075 RepID=UPI0024A8FE8F|nr:3-hydroxyacyl-CoA dehydrogenase family protein [Leucobacter sp. UT-8R-CII-1-4]MDI6023550.1 3-hydroxyacyl-CoA dehydrogenase family protein [Leucobacter sp. UT-8R-CII-1-4]
MTETQSPKQRSIVVIGGGIMGAGIAIAMANAGHRVSVVEPDQARAAALRERLQEIPKAAVGQIGADWAPIAEADYVFEAAPENLQLKQQLWARLGEVARADAVLATNTSSLDVDDLAWVVPEPGRVLAAHWFNPAYEVQCVELAPGSQTAVDTIQAVTELLSAAGKTPVSVQNRPGFIANRIQFAMIREAMLCLEDGASREAIDEVVRTSFAPRLAALGPLANADLGGLDTYLSIFETLQGVFGERFAPPQSLVDAVAAGRLGTKTLAGFDDYDEDSAAALAAERDRRLSAVIAAVR